MNYQANVNAIAQQAREQQLKHKQAAVKAEVELDRLKGLLHREQTLQVLCNAITIWHKHTSRCTTLVSTYVNTVMCTAAQHFDLLPCISLLYKHIFK